MSNVVQELEAGAPSPQQVALAARSLAEMGPDADLMAPIALAAELSRRAAVGDHAAIAVALSTRPSSDRGSR